MFSSHQATGWSEKGGGGKALVPTDWALSSQLAQVPPHAQGPTSPSARLQLTEDRAGKPGSLQPSVQRFLPGAEERVW